MAGPHIAVAGAVFADRFICQPLTDYMFVGPYSSSSESTCSRLEAGILRFAKLMHVLNVCLDDLRKYYKDLEKCFASPEFAQVSSALVSFSFAVWFE